MMCAEKRSLAQPSLPQFHGERWPFVSPHDSIAATAHSPAALKFGDPVRRGPYTSARKCTLRRICERALASSRMRVRTSSSLPVCAPSLAATRISANHVTQRARHLMVGGHATTLGKLRRLPAPMSISFRRAFIWLTACVLLTYAPDIGRGFVADDFGWIYFSRIDSLAKAWQLLVEGAPGFYRPMVALSFGIDELVYGLNPTGYAITNLAMAFAIVVGIIWLGVSLRLSAVAAVFGAGLWILNFHGISTALLWISGRTSLLTTMFAVFAAVALVRGRSLWAGWLTLASLMSKEEPVMLPVVFALWLWTDRRPILAIARTTWPSFAALAIY